MPWFHGCPDKTGVRIIGMTAMRGALVKVRAVIQRLERDGWRLVAIRGSHRQFKHPDRPGRVTVAGKPGDDLAAGTLRSIAKQSGIQLP